MRVALTQALQTSGVNSAFTAANAQSEVAEARVVLAFGGQKGDGNVCRWSTSSTRWPQTIPGGQGKITMVATLCYRERPLSEVTGSMPITSRADDPAVIDLVHHMSMDLFPRNALYHSS